MKWILQIGLSVLFIAMFFVTITALLEGQLIRNQAIELGYAYYNPTNGNWQWKMPSEVCK